MDFVDLLRQQREEGLAEGEARGLAKVEVNTDLRVQQIAIDLLRLPIMTVEKIAEVTKLDISHLTELKIELRAQEIAIDLLRISTLTLEQIAEVTQLNMSQLMGLKDSKNAGRFRNNPGKWEN